jgi:hypothetical protein
VCIVFNFQHVTFFRVHSRILSLIQLMHACKKRLDAQAINKYKPLPKKTRGELKMKAARFYRVDNPLTIEEIPTPTPGSGEVLVRVKASGICGSDLYTYHFYPPKSFGLRSLTLGHECVVCVGGGD